jgi:hypothetical protein
MNAAPSRVGLRLVASGYAAVTVVSAALIFMRYLQYARHPDDVAAYGGMYAGGDLMLELMIGCMLLVPTAVLVFVIRNHEAAYTTYSKVLLGLSITCPFSVGIISIPAVAQGTSILGWVCMFRLFGSPLVLVALVSSLLLARFRRSRLLIASAVCVEFLTLVVLMALLMSSGKHHG